MSRSLTAAMLTEIAKAKLRLCLFFEAEFSSGLTNLWSGTGPITWDSKTWTGVGNLGRVDAMEENSEMHAAGCVFSISGIPAAFVTKALGEVRQGKPVKLWIGSMDDAGAVIADPYLQFFGRMDVGSIEEDPENCVIKITAENRLLDLGKSRGRRMTHEDQQLRYPGDLGFEYVNSIQNWNGVWGKAGVTVPQQMGDSGVPSEDPTRPLGW